MELDVVQLAQELIAHRSESQVSNVAANRHIAGVLQRAGFEVEELSYVDGNEVDKSCLVARLGEGTGGLSLMGHSDTVPARRDDGWSADPCSGRVHRGRLYGRGACDMKGPLAASLCAAARFAGERLAAPLFIVVTADEELQARGAREVVGCSRLFDAAASGYGVICEPTRLRVVHAHKGALAMTATASGRAAHTSTLRGVNANVKMIPFLSDMKRIYDRVLTSPAYRNDEFDPPHSEWSLGINDHNLATNMCPVRSVCTISYRPMPGVDVERLIAATRKSALRHGVDLKVTFQGLPLYTPPDSPLVRTALRLTGTRKAHSVPYGTDGLAYRAKMAHMVVLGPGDIAQAHTVDEWIDVDELRRSVDVYARFVEHVCLRPA